MNPRSPPASSLPDRRHLRGVMMVMTAGLLWSLGGVIVRLTESASDWQILFYRSTSLSLFLLLVIGRGRPRELLRILKAAAWPGLFAGIGVSLAFAGFVLSITHTAAANSFFLLGSQPMLTALLALLILGERVSALGWGTMALALIGVTVMVWGGLAVGQLFGNLMGLMSAVGFAVFTVALRYGRLADMRPAILYGGFFSGALAAAMLVSGGESFVLSARDTLLCITLGVAQVGFGMLIYIAGSRFVPANELALLAMVEIVFGPIWPWWIVGEVPPPTTLAGGAIILFALLIRALVGARSKGEQA